MKLSRRELLTGAAAISAVAVLPAPPAFGEEAIYIKADPAHVSGAWVLARPYDVNPRLIGWQFGIAA